MSSSRDTTEIPGGLTDSVTRTVYATDNSIYQVEPHAVILPGSAGEIEALLRRNFAAAEPRPIVARGAGTGTNGQSLTSGLMVDVKRRLNRVIDIDPTSRTATVEPGIVTARLNDALAAHDLFWAPHTSTLNRATVGGMIATDAAGKGSLIHGRAHRHVLALDVVLDDGTPWRAEPLPVAAAERRAGADDRIGRLWRALLDLPLDEGADLGLPELARGFSGYGIDRVRRSGLIDPIPLLCGSEGTLAVITSATLRLTPIPRHTVLVVAGYTSFGDALNDAVDLAVTKPAAIESFDETTLERGRSSPAWPALGAVVGEHSGSVLMLEYSANHEIDLDPIIETLARTQRSRVTKAVTDPAAQAAVWKVRADAVGLVAKVATGSPGLSARPTAFVEDCAVPVREMPEFIARFRSVLDEFGLEYAMFGHADVGCVHVRPALDLTDPAHERLIRTVTDRVVELVADHGGVLWGEHGRGFRGDPVERFLPESTIAVMRMVKAAFDPTDLLNPGKLYRPTGTDQPLVALDAAPQRGRRNRDVRLEVRQEFGGAFACNGNGLCHHYDHSEVMCPSYKATGDPALSPKGRADLLRAWLARSGERSNGHERGSDNAEEFRRFEDDLAANLHQCLSCSACTGHCPVAVDIPELKSQFLQRYHRNRSRPRSDALLSRFEYLVGYASSIPGPIARLGSAALGRSLGLVDLPVPPPRQSGSLDLPVFSVSGAADLVILPDVFTRSLEPETLTKAYAVLTSLGYRVEVAPFVPSGKFDHVKGNRRAFAQAASTQAEVVRAVQVARATPMVIEPAIGLLHRHEYALIAPGYPAGEVIGLPEAIERRLDHLPKASSSRSLTLLGHCTERAMAPDWLAGWERILVAAGHSVAVPPVGCCGMAGVFGHERDHQEMSVRLFEMSWAEHVVGGESLPVATGYSCRSQAKRLGAGPVVHPVHLL